MCQKVTINGGPARTGEEGEWESQPYVCSGVSKASEQSKQSWSIQYLRPWIMEETKAGKATPSHHAIRSIALSETCLSKGWQTRSVSRKWTVTKANKLCASLGEGKSSTGWLGQAFSGVITYQSTGTIYIVTPFQTAASVDCKFISRVFHWLTTPSSLINENGSDRNSSLKAGNDPAWRKRIKDSIQCKEWRRKK